MRADGTNQERVTSLPGNEYQPDWSPDGRSLVFVYADTDALYTVMLVSRGGDGRWSAPRPLSTALVRLPRLDILPARWSPDGSTFAVASNDSIHFVSPNGVIERSIGRPWADPTDLEGSMLWNPVDNSLIVHQLPANGLNTFWSVPSRRACCSGSMIPPGVPAVATNSRQTGDGSTSPLRTMRRMSGS
jgi:dipeptidyl aminopeptidase/acylaminoacyl peptidase